MGKTLYLHIGHRKTATTSIQMAMVNNRRLLNRHGFDLFWEMPDDEKSHSQNGDVNAWLSGYYGLNLYENAWNTYKWELFRRASELPFPKVIISSEQFSWFFNPGDIQEVYTIASRFFEEIKIIVYIRRQDDFLVANYRQVGVQPHGPDYFVGSPRALPSFERDYSDLLDYNRSITKWEEVFGKSNIKIGLFAQELLRNGDAVGDFFSLLGITEPVSIVKTNIAKGFERTKVGHLLRKNLDSGSYWYTVLKSSADNSGEILPARAEAEAVYARYRDSNIALNQRYQLSAYEAIFSDDFSQYPEKALDLWDEDSANRAISNILQAINRHTSDDALLWFLFKQKLRKCTVLRWLWNKASRIRPAATSWKRRVVIGSVLRNEP